MESPMEGGMEEGPPDGSTGGPELLRKETMARKIGERRRSSRNSGVEKEAEEGGEMDVIVSTLEVEAGGREGSEVAEVDLSLSEGSLEMLGKGQVEIREGPLGGNCMEVVAAEEVFVDMSSKDEVAGLIEESQLEKGETDGNPLIIDEIDNALDVIKAQPLQNMEFLKSGEVLGEMRPLLESKSDVRLVEAGVASQYDMEAGMKKMNEDFPPLSKDSFKGGKYKNVQTNLQQGKAGKTDQRLTGGEVNSGKLLMDSNLGVGTSSPQKAPTPVDIKRKARVE